MRALCYIYHMIIFDDCCIYFQIIFIYRLKASNCCFHHQLRIENTAVVNQHVHLDERLGGPRTNSMNSSMATALDSRGRAPGAPEEAPEAGRLGDLEDPPRRQDDPRLRSPLQDEELHLSGFPGSGGVAKGGAMPKGVLGMVGSSLEPQRYHGTG